MTDMVSLKHIDRIQSLYINNNSIVDRIECILSQEKSQPCSISIAGMTDAGRLEGEILFDRSLLD